MVEETGDVPDLDLDQVREDFFCIWQKNVIDVELIREQNPQGSDYFYEDEDVDVLPNRTIPLNVQGVNSNAYLRAQQGIVTTDAHFHAYAKFDEDIEETDIILFPVSTTIANTIINKGDKFRIVNFNKSSYAGQMVFQEFDLKKIGPSDE